MILRQRAVDFQFLSVFRLPEDFRRPGDRLRIFFQIDLEGIKNRVSFVGRAPIGPVLAVALEYPVGRFGQVVFREFVDGRTNLVDRADNKGRAVCSPDVPVENRRFQRRNISGRDVLVAEALSFRAVAAVEPAGR